MASIPLDDDVSSLARLLVRAAERQNVAERLHELTNAFIIRGFPLSWRYPQLMDGLWLIVH